MPFSAVMGSPPDPSFVMRVQTIMTPAPRTFNEILRRAAAAIPRRSTLYRGDRPLEPERRDLRKLLGDQEGHAVELGEQGSRDGDKRA